MLAAILMLGFPSAKEFGEFGLNCLAVAGGFAVGYFLGAILAFALDRWAFNKKSPDVLKKALRVLAGIALALLIAFLVFRGGGGWGGGNGPEGPGSNGSENPDSGKKADPAHPTPHDPKPQPKIDTPKSPELRPDDPKVRVTFLGGDAVQGDHFYLIDDDQAPKTFAELKAIVQKRKDSATAPLTLIVLYPSDPKQRIDPSSINVTQVTSWAEGLGIGVFKPGKK